MSPREGSSKALGIAPNPPMDEHTVDDPQVVATHSHWHFVLGVGGASREIIHECAFNAINNVGVQPDGTKRRPRKLVAQKKIRWKILMWKLRIMCIGNDETHHCHHVAEIGGLIDLLPHIYGPPHERA